MGITELKLPAIEISQGKTKKLYCFGVDGKLVPSFAAVSRIRRQNGNGGDIIGYQRPEVLSHVSEIRAYLESNDPMFPNSVVVAFEDSVRFEPSKEVDDTSAYSCAGTIVIPVDESLPDDEKPGWVVDGQQRLAAIREANVDSFPVCVVAFIAASDKEQREQFILVNSTKPLSKGLIYELLPSTETHLPTMLRRRRFPAQLLERLNYDDDSPLKGMILTPTNPSGIIRDNSMLKMLENSLTDGVLYRYKERGAGGGDVESMLRLLKSYWLAVATVFEDIWGLPPRRSRLVHGAGIISLGFLMDAISDRFDDSDIPACEQFIEDLRPIRDICHWTAGYWEIGLGIQRRWNEIQNTPKDIQMLANHLLTQYRELVWNRTAGSHAPSKG